MQETYDYQAYYCEENVWRLCVHERLAGVPLRVVFASNAARRCPVWCMRAGEVDEPVLWDYHVFLLVWRGEWRVWDLDSTLGLDVPLEDYLALSFRLGSGPLAPRFRVVEAALFLAEFRSDRNHMRDRGRWLAPPPPWPAPSPEGVSNLQDWIEMKRPFRGMVCTSDGLADVLNRG